MTAFGLLLTKEIRLVKKKTEGALFFLEYAKCLHVDIKQFDTTRLDGTLGVNKVLYGRSHLVRLQ
jgi:hypothetical protein